MKREKINEFLYRMKTERIMMIELEEKNAFYIYLFSLLFQSHNCFSLLEIYWLCGIKIYFYLHRKRNEIIVIIIISIRIQMKKICNAMMQYPIRIRSISNKNLFANNVYRIFTIIINITKSIAAFFCFK